MILIEPEVHIRLYLFDLLKFIIYVSPPSHPQKES